MSLADGLLGEVGAEAKGSCQVPGASSHSSLPLTLTREGKGPVLHAGSLQCCLGTLATSPRNHPGKMIAPDEPPPCCRAAQLLQANLLSLTR